MDINSNLPRPLENGEKPAEQETIERETLAEQLRLKKDSNLVSILLSFNKEERDNMITSFFNEGEKNHGRYGAIILWEIFQSLNQDAFIPRIKTLEDFERYAKKMVQILEPYLGRNKKGEPERYGYAEGFIPQTVADMILLIRDDFDRDLDTLIEMTHNNPSLEQVGGIIEKLSHIHGLIRTSDDLKRFGKFVKRLSENPTNKVYANEHIYPLFGNQFSKTYRRDENGQEIYKPDQRFQIWQEIITDSKKLNDTLSAIELAFEHGANPDALAKQINSLPKGEREQCLNLLKNVFTKNLIQPPVKKLPLNTN